MYICVRILITYRLNFFHTKHRFVKPELLPNQTMALLNNWNNMKINCLDKWPHPIHQKINLWQENVLKLKLKKQPFLVRIMNYRFEKFAITFQTSALML